MEKRRLAARNRRDQRKFYAAWVVQTMTAGVQGAAEWRVRYVAGPDLRSLTARLLGDPHWGRSALYARLQTLRPTLEQEFQLTAGLLL